MTRYQSCMKRELKGERHRSVDAQQRAFGKAATNCAKGTKRTKRRR